MGSRDRIRKTLMLLLGACTAGSTFAQESFDGVGNFAGSATVTFHSTRRVSATTGTVRFAFPVGSSPILEEVQFRGSSISLPLVGNQPTPSGVLSFRLKGIDPLVVSSDGSFRGTVQGTVHFPLITTLVGYEPIESGFEGVDDVGSRSYRMEGTVTGRFSVNPRESSVPVPVELAIEMRSTSSPIRAPLDWSSRIGFTIVRNILSGVCLNQRRLCVQPVGIRSSSSDSSPTGAAYDTLMAEAREMWSRVCITFEERPFKYVDDASYDSMTWGSGEEYALLDEVDDDDCIEVFFIKEWTNPEDLGAGATFSGGEADAKVITSDQNDNGIDLNHLAHELGHVLDLKHPGTGCPSPDCPDRYDGSEGTVLCPSGYENDNPAVQSRENGLLANNPLLVYVPAIGPRSPDCMDSDDCGPCP